MSNTQSSELGGPVEKKSFFQIAPMTKVSTQIRSSMCQYDVYKVSSKKMSERGPLGVSKSTFFFGGVSSGLGYRILQLKVYCCVGQTASDDHQHHHLLFDCCNRLCLVAPVLPLADARRQVVGGNKCPIPNHLS